MSIFVIGGTGFIGHRLVRLLVARGQTVTSMDINPAAHSFADLGGKVTSVRGDVTQFDDLMAAMSKAKPERVINLSYFIGSDHAPHVAMKLNILGMDNCFEAARILGVKHTMYASSLAVNGRQTHYGDRPVTEDDRVNGEYQYAKHKIINEWQAQDYTEKHGMLITGIRPANVTGPDKVRGSVDHVNIITEPARGNAIRFPFKDAMRCPIHVDDIAEVFARVLLAEKPKHRIYNSGGISVSLGEIADIVRGYLPDAKISFDKDTGGREPSGNYRIDNARLMSEFGVQYRPYRERVLQIINDVRRDNGKPPVG
ncbi:MAG: NAD(P)-dependent oxidoreductase [Hyphomicrobiaceae bacterium]|nr:NAD(P)-dependent oxidoreductase [Hyphomicrobiaceae bacterium]